MRGDAGGMEVRCGAVERVIETKGREVRREGPYSSLKCGVVSASGMELKCRV